MRYVTNSHVLAYKTTCSIIGHAQTTKAKIKMRTRKNRSTTCQSVYHVYSPKSLIVIIVKIEFPCFEIIPEAGLQSLTFLSMYAEDGLVMNH